MKKLTLVVIFVLTCFLLKGQDEIYFDNGKVTYSTDAESARNYIINMRDKVWDSEDNILYQTKLIFLCEAYDKKYSDTAYQQSFDIFLMRSSIEVIKLQALYERGRIKANSEDYRGAIIDMSDAILICKKPLPPLGSSDVLPLYLRHRGQCYASLNEMKSACKDWNEAVNLGDSEALKFVVEYCQ